MNAIAQDVWDEVNEVFDRNHETRELGKKPAFILSQWEVSTRFAGTPPPREWLVENTFLMGKPSLLAAAGGIGKSFLLLDLCVKLATFKPNKPAFTAFGKLSRGGVAVMLCAEDDATEIHNRLSGIGKLPQTGRLIVVPLPDVGGIKPLFEIDPQTRAPITAQAFHDLHDQLRIIPDLALVVLDPLQALCGGLDLNLPQHGQHICGALAQLGADTGATIIVSHHFRKSGEIKSPEDAREAIRGSGGLVDGVRCAVALWPDNSDDSRSVCKRLATEWQRNKVCKMAVVKANFRADLYVKTLVRENDGLLEDRSFDLYNVTPKISEVYDKLFQEIESIASTGKPFAKTGQNGIYQRRHELSSYFHEWGRQKLEDTVQELLNNKRIAAFEIPYLRKGAHIWLGSATGCLAPTEVAE